MFKIKSDKEWDVIRESISDILILELKINPEIRMKSEMEIHE